MSRVSPSSGFTLIEVLVALATVSELVVGAAGLLSTASLAIRSARLGTTATFLALQKVEQLEASPAGLTSGSLQDYFAVDSRPAPAASAAYVRRWTVTTAWAGFPNASVVVEVFASGAGKLAEIHAVVSTEGGGAP